MLSLLRLFSPLKLKILSTIVALFWTQISFAHESINHDKEFSHKKIREAIILASTTSTQNSGLFDYLLPIFTQETGIRVNVVAVGTGAALKLARNGDADILMVHHKSSEEQFVAEGFGVKRFDLMYNDFVFIGPKSDPANVKTAKDLKTALQAIAAHKEIFLSRGDDSGTHKKELELWKAAGLASHDLAPNWYREAGAGMGATLNVTVAINGYTMSDRATWTAFNNKQDHDIVFEGDPTLFNQYGIILINPERFPHIKAAASQEFIDWILSPKGQKIIGSYQLLGQQLFTPNAEPKN